MSPQETKRLLQMEKHILRHAKGMEQELRKCCYGKPTFYCLQCEQVDVQAASKSKKRKNHK